LYRYTVAGLVGGVETYGDAGAGAGDGDTGAGDRDGDAGAGAGAGDGDGDGDGGEDGEGGDANDVAGNGGEWGGSLGRFGLMECFDYPLYNTLVGAVHVQPPSGRLETLMAA
jgi:hypothetical protein